MASEQSQPRSTPSPLIAANGQQSIKIRELRFSRPTGVDVPVPGAHGGLNRLVAGKRDSGEEYTIELLPWIRQYVVRHTAADGIKVMFLVLESWGLAIPESQSP